MDLFFSSRNLSRNHASIESLRSIMKGILTFLGTGSSVGIPIICCSCAVCVSNDPRNKRLRPSVQIIYDDKIFLIDIGPDFRQQALRNEIHSVDGILLTHSHYDHTGGFDDLRALSFRRETPIPLLLSEETAKDLKLRYFYLFHQFAPKFELNILQNENGIINFLGLPIQYVSYEQSGMKVNGFRIGDLAYLTDIRNYSESIFEELKGVRYLIISALRDVPSPLHLSVDEAIAFSKNLHVEKTWFTHISHDLEHVKTNADLPVNIQLAYDGLEIEFN